MVAVGRAGQVTVGAAIGRRNRNATRKPLTRSYRHFLGPLSYKPKNEMEERFTRATARLEHQMTDPFKKITDLGHAPKDLYKYASD